MNRLGHTNPNQVGNFKPAKMGKFKTALTPPKKGSGLSSD